MVSLALALAPQALPPVAAQCQDLCAAGWLSCEVDVCDPTACGAAASNATSTNCLACVNSVCDASAAVFSVHITVTHDRLIWCVFVPFLGRLVEYVLVAAMAKLFPRSVRALCSRSESGKGGGKWSALTRDEAEDTTGSHGAGADTAVAAQSAFLPPPPPIGETADTTQEWADRLVPGAGYTEKMVRSAGSSWERAVYANGQSQLSATLAAVSKLFLWHWLQPVLYFVVFNSYWGEIDNWQVRAAAVTCMCVLSRTPRLLQVVFV